MLISKNDVVLFQGDSITDCSRDKNDPDSLGRGYALFAASQFMMRRPEMNVTFYNRGISGNVVKDLEDRWQADCLDIKPDVLSVLIGVNNCGRRYTRNEPTTAEEFYATYVSILSRAKEQNPDLKIIILEPFLLTVKEDLFAWREDLDFKIDAARKAAKEFADAYVPLDGILNAVYITAPDKFLGEDGIHPSAAGHAIIAKHWLEAVENSE